MIMLFAIRPASKAMIEIGKNIIGNLVFGLRRQKWASWARPKTKTPIGAV